jgi:hypothetical protein
MMAFLEGSASPLRNVAKHVEHVYSVAKGATPRRGQRGSRVPGKDQQTNTPSIQ